MAEIDSRELTEWQLYDQLDPIGESRADLRMAILASVIANVNRDPKKRPRPYKPEDFMPEFEQATKPSQSWQEQMMIMKAFGEMQ